MITEAVIGLLIDLVTFLFASVVNFATAPISGTFSIPRPLFFIAELQIIGFTAIYPVIGLWFLWRQVWGK